MNDELIARLLRYSRNCIASRLDPDFADAIGEAIKTIGELRVLKTLADAKIERLEAQLLKEPHWIPFETRPMDAEEREYYSEHYGFGLTDDEAVIYVSQLPEPGQEVLVCTKWGHIWIDTFDDDPDYGIGFETNGDMDGLVAWMPLPEPYKLPKEGETDV